MLFSFLLTSCVTIVKGLYGNQIMDSNFNPLPQEQIFFVEVPYVLQDGLVVIKTFVNDSKKEYRFVFDTGADTVISEDLLSELNISNASESVALDAHGQYSKGSTFRTDLMIDSLRVRNIRVSSTNSNLFNQKCDNKLDGIVGWNILKQGYFYFNPINKTLTITNDKAKISSIMFQNSIHLKRKMAKPYIKIKGKRNFWILLDTGYSDGYISTHRSSGLLDRKLNVIKNKQQMKASLNSKKIWNVDYFEQKVHFGNFSKFQQVAVSDAKTSRIGNKLLQENHLIIDVASSKLYLTPIPKESEKVEISNIGFSYDNGNVVVASMVNQSVFGIAGLQMNDTIIKFNEHRVDNLKDYCEFKELFTKLKFPLTIVFKNGTKQSEITTTREEYYD